MKPSGQYGGARPTIARLSSAATCLSLSACSSDMRTARGQKIAYVVDAAYHEENVDRIVALARGADQLFI